MTQSLPEPDSLKRALREIAEARAHLERAGDALTALASPADAPQNPPKAADEARELALGPPPHDLLDIARGVSHQILPETLAQRASGAGERPRDWLYRVYSVSIAPRGISEPVASIVVMLAAVKFGLRHQLLLQTENRLGLAHKTAIPNLDRFLEAFIDEMAAADRDDKRLNDWLRHMVARHYPGFREGKRVDLPGGAGLILPERIDPIRPRAKAPIAATALTSPMDPAAAVLIPPGSGWRITLGYSQILQSQAHPAYHGKRHSGIDIYRWNGYRAPVHAMRAGVVIESLYLPKGFGHTVVIEHEDGSCLRYTHLDTRLVNPGDRVARGQKLGTVGKGAKKIYAAHLHLDMPRSRAYSRARSYYDTAAEVAERFINPLSQIPARVPAPAADPNPTR